VLPEIEINLLKETVDIAIGWVAEGRVGEGYVVLSDGLRRARELPGEPWREELVGRWRLACDNFADTYGVSLPDSDP
jgi:hypothetical protein